MENNNNLFSIKTKENFPVWDIIRHNVWDNIISEGRQINYSNRSKSVDFFINIKPILIFIKYLIIFVFSFFKHHNFLFIGFSRFKNHENKLEDIHFKFLTDVLPISCKFYFYEVFINKSNYDNTNRIYDLVYYIDKIYHKSLVENENLEKIKKIIDLNFNKNNISVYEMQKILNLFYIEYKIFSFLLKLKKIKGVFLVSKFKGLCLASKENNIPTFELQHGDIVKSTIQYNYSVETLNIEKSSFIYPDVLFTYSNKWIENNNLFSECIELGKVNFNRDDLFKLYNHDIAIISSPGHYEILKIFTLKLSKRIPEKIIYFKLHPMEQNLVDDTLNYFLNYPNVKVIEGTDVINILYKRCSHFVAIYSSVLYEAYEHQYFIYILKELNYLNYSNLCNLPDVVLISNIDQFEFAYKQNSLKYMKSKDFKFEYYKRFNPEILIQNVKNKCHF